MNTTKRMLATREPREPKMAGVLSAEAGRRRFGTWVCPGASEREGSNAPGSARLNVAKTAFARLGLPSPTSIFLNKEAMKARNGQVATD